MRKTTELFAGWECFRLETDALTLWATRSVGPRIVGLAPRGGENLFAVLPGEGIDYPGGGRLLFCGGHRLWYAPEDPWRTYIPDNDPVEVVELEQGLRLIQPVEKQTGIQKSITVLMKEWDARMEVEHTLRNLGNGPVELAPWAITQMRPGGVAILPQPTDPADPYGVLPNRQIALWPYTRVNSPYILWGDRFIFVRATMDQGALKVGFPNPVGWLAYAWEGVLFVKYASYNPEATYYDRGSSSECYCNPLFLELETLGPRVRLGPGESVSHRETWAVFTDIAFRPDEAVVEELARNLGL
ncbi:MAG: hypothetical protein D6793_07825 [Thermoflexia bacterium]|nr:MAG: hypothetical protein D6793_07825 [Thermoflexia bacterium]